MALSMGHVRFRMFNFRVYRGFKTCTRLDKVNPKDVKGNKSSYEWVKRQINDPYIKLARDENYRCRSAFKLIEIDNKYNLFTHSTSVVDCGAAPGSWSQVAVRRIQSKQTRGLSKCNPQVVAVDLLHIDPLDGVTSFGSSDFTKEETQCKILEALNGKPVDVVISDMAPNASGNKDLDHDNICKLCLSVLQFSSKVLNNGGHVLCKLWDGQDRVKIMAIMNRMFKNVHIIKPRASRSDSAEIFLLGMDYFLRPKK